MKSRIEKVEAHRIWDSRGRPTVEVEVTLGDGTIGRGIAPAGASRGSHEAIDLRDSGLRHGGLDVRTAVGNVNAQLSRALVGMDALDQSSVDALIVAIDGTENKSRLGGNGTIATSMGVMHAAAASLDLPLWRYLSAGGECRLPMPEIQIFGGGAHAGRRVDIQDFLVVPAGAASFDEALAMCSDIYRLAGDLMARRKGRSGVADEGGWWPDFESNEEALTTLCEAIELAGCGGGRALISLDIAASEFYENGRYRLGLDRKDYDTDGWLEQVCRWVEGYPIISVEDPVAENDADGMRAFTAAVGHRIQVVGDDFLVTSARRVAEAARQNCCNAALIKPNQVGTISEARSALLEAKNAGWGTIISARSGETEDVCITHLAVGWNAGQLKVGSFARSERMAKWNEGLRIERQNVGLGFAGMNGLPCSTARQDERVARVATS